MKNQENMIKTSIKWWLDYMDGTTDKVEKENAQAEMKDYSKEQIDDLIKNHQTSELKRIYKLLLAIDDYNKKKDYYINKEQRRRLEIELTTFIKRELKNKNIAYLYTDENGFAGGILAVAMYYSQIKTGKDEENAVAILPKDVEMFITNTKADIRYNGNSPLSTLYEIDDEQKY